MADVALNKASLKQQREQLATFQDFLPSLDLKRRRMLYEQRRQESELREINAAIDDKYEDLSDMMLLAGESKFETAGLLKVAGVTLGSDNIAGARLPRLDGIDFEIDDRPALDRPFWLPEMLKRLRDLSGLHIRRELQRRRVAALAKAVKTVTQRINLFEKVLIPEAQENIRRIKIHLADMERAAVVRSKLVKAKREQELLNIGD